MEQLSGYQLSPFDLGQVKAHMHHGLSSAAIAGIITKPNGVDHWSPNAIWEATKASSGLTKTAPFESSIRNQCLPIR